MIAILCKILRPLCVVSTIGVMLLLIAHFWGAADFLQGNILRLLFSYVVLIVGSFVIFFINDPSFVSRARDR